MEKQTKSIKQAYSNLLNAKEKLPCIDKPSINIIHIVHVNDKLSRNCNVCDLVLQLFYQVLNIKINMVVAC